MPLLEYPLAGRLYLTPRCNLNCPDCLNRKAKDPYTPTVDAMYGDIYGDVIECYELGIRLLELAGGDPLLWPWIVEILTLCKELGIFTLLPVSGLGLTDSFKKIGAEWLSLPGILRISTHHYPNFGIRTLGEVEEALKVVRRFRAPNSTQLSILLTPGVKGNLSWEFLEPIFLLAEKFLCPIHLIPVIGTWQGKNWNKIRFLWENLTDRERNLLFSLIQEPLVLSRSIDKVLFRLNGGNNPEHTLCQAGNTVFTINNGKDTVPCDLITKGFEKFDSIVEALGSETRKESVERRGAYDFCPECTAGCNDVMDSLRGHSSFEELVRAYCEM